VFVMLASSRLERRRRALFSHRPPTMYLPTLFPASNMLDGLLPSQGGDHPFAFNLVIPAARRPWMRARPRTPARATGTPGGPASALPVALSAPLAESYGEPAPGISTAIVCTCASCSCMRSPWTGRCG
jgi:hypothetical protein